MSKPPKAARVGEIAFRDRCPADGQRVRVRVRGARRWWLSPGVWDARDTRVVLAPGRAIVMARLTAWLPEGG